MQYQAKPMTEEASQEILHKYVIEQMAKIGLRCILYAYRDMSVDEFEDLKTAKNGFQLETDRECLETDLTFLAVFGLKDDLRADVKEAVAFAKTGAINVRMVSGDNIHTAKY